MYSVTPRLADSWRALVEAVMARADVAFDELEFPPPNPIDDMWARQDLGLAQMCGWPFDRAQPKPQPLAAMVPDDPVAEGQPVYWSDMVVRADASFDRLEDTFGGVIGWTVRSSQSGFNAARYLLLPHFREAGGPLYRESVGGLISPRGAIQAVIDGRVDVAPVDSFAHLLMRRGDAAFTSQVRTIARTPKAPIPMFVASAAVDPMVAKRLSAILLTADADPVLAALMDPVAVKRFVAVDAAAYGVGERWAEAALAAGYSEPA